MYERGEHSRILMYRLLILAAQHRCLQPLLRAARMSQDACVRLEQLKEEERSCFEDIRVTVEELTTFVIEILGQQKDRASQAVTRAVLGTPLIVALAMPGSSIDIRRQVDAAFEICAMSDETNIVLFKSRAARSAGVLLNDLASV